MSVVHHSDIYSHGTMDHLAPSYSASKLHKVLFDTTKRMAFDKTLPSSVPKIPDQSTRNTRLKPLLSPIILTPPTGVSDANDSTEDTPYDLAHDYEPTMDPARTFVDGNRCPFPPHKMNAISNDCQDAARGESSLSLGSNRATHRRSLSMVDSFVSTFPLEDDVGRRCQRNLFGDRRSAAKSKELRRSAGSLSLKKNCGPWVGQIVEATKRAGSQQPHEIGHRSSNNLRNKPRLRLDATNPEQGVAQAVRPLIVLTGLHLLTGFQHVTTFTPSPTKPRVISISHRSSLGTPPKQPSPASREGQQLPPTYQPATPPGTPIGLGIASNKPSGRADQEHSIGDECPRVTYPYTPPNSRVSTPRARSTVRLGATAPPTDSQPRSSPHTSRITSAWNGRAGLIMDELEAALHNYPTARLYLDSPVIQDIRTLNSMQRFTIQSPSSFNGSTRPICAAPHSRYSIFQALSSHPVMSQATRSKRGVQVQGTAQLAPALVSQSSVRSPNRGGDPTLSALRVIFPQVPAALLDSLQATYLALNYVLSSPDTSSGLLSERLSTPPSSPSFLSVSSIPPKALATLGIQTPLPSAARTSWLRPATPTGEDNESHMTEDVAHLRERRGNLQVSLRILVRGLLSEIEGRRLTKRDESLMRAVGEVVRFGEIASNGREKF